MKKKHTPDIRSYLEGVLTGLLAMLFVFILLVFTVFKNCITLPI